MFKIFVQFQSPRLDSGWMSPEGELVHANEAARFSEQEINDAIYGIEMADVKEIRIVRDPS